MKIDKLVLELNQITPLFHFKYGTVKGNETYNINNNISRETNEGLRATELKPRFIKYINSLNSEIKYNSSNIRININQKFCSQETLKGGLLDLINKVPEQESLNIKENFIYLKDITITLKIIPQKDEEIEKEILFQEFIKFLNSFSFGKRSSKGYGSFEVNKILSCTCNCKLAKKSKVRFDKKKEIKIMPIQEKDKKIMQKNKKIMRQQEKKIVELKKKIIEELSSLNKKYFETKFLYSMLLGSNVKTEYGEKVTIKTFLETENEFEGFVPPYRIKFCRGWIGIIYEDKIMDANISYLERNVTEKYKETNFELLKTELENYIKNDLLDNLLKIEEKNEKYKKPNRNSNRANI